jgi:ribosomal protein L4
MNLKLISKGAQAQDVQVSDATFAREYNESLVHQIIVAYMAAGRAGTKAQKTKLLVEKLKELNQGDNVLVLVEAFDEKLELASRNLPYVDVLPVSALDPLSLARHDQVLATVGAVRLLEERLA